MKFSVLLLLLAPAAALHAQVPPPVTATLSANTVKARLNSHGEIFNFDGTPGLTASPAGLTDFSLARGGGLWIIGRDSLGELVGAIHGFHGQPGDFAPGHDGAPQFNNVWSVTCTDIEEQLADLADNDIIDDPNPYIYGWPSTGNPYFAATYPQFAPLPLTTASLAGFYDHNNDAYYDPGAGDYPSVEIRYCPNNVYPKQQLWTVSTDQTPHVFSGLQPIDVEIQTQMFAFQVEPAASILNNTIFIRYKIINRGSSLLDSIYVGVSTDFLIGSSGHNDYAGSAPAEGMMFGYEADVNATESPALGIAMLRGPLRYLEAQDSVGEIGLTHARISQFVPDSPEQFYRHMRGLNPDGTPAPDNGFEFAGNPNDAEAPTELALGTMPGHRHGVASYGPFTLHPGAVNEMMVAYFYGYTPGATILENVQMLFDSVGTIRAAADACFSDLNLTCAPIVDAPVLPDAPPARLYPNPTAKAITVERPGAPFARLEITDALGRRIQHLELPSNTERFELPVNRLAAGLYFLRLDHGHAMPFTVKP